MALAGVGQPLAHQTEADCIYLDYNATTPIFPEVAQQMLPFVTTHFGNPSSGHAYGRPCADAVKQVRERVARMINAQPQEVVFTSCGTESDNWAIWGAITAHPAAGRQAASLPHVVTSAVEHPAVLECLSALQQQGLCTYTAVPVTAEGLVTPAAVSAALRPETALVTIMHSNNEVGALQPVAQIAALAQQHGALMHTDAAQSIGKVALDVDSLGVDLLTVVGHKFGAPKGVAALYIRSGTKLGRLLHGGGQEGGRRAGTENVLLAVGLGAAADLVTRELPATAAHMAALRDRLQRRLQAAFPQEGAVRMNGPANDAERLPNTLSISVRHLDAAALLGALADQVAASGGSACHAGAAAASPVLAAMQVPLEYALGTLRLSVGRHTTAQQVDRAADLIIQAAQQQLGCARTQHT